MTAPVPFKKCRVCGRVYDADTFFRTLVAPPKGGYQECTNGPWLVYRNCANAGCGSTMAVEIAPPEGLL